MHRLSLCAGAALSAGIGCRETGQAGGACPTLAGQRIRWVVPNAPGGGFDTESRMLQPFLEERLAARIVVDNQPGAGGLIGVRTIVEARPDGRTLGITSTSGLAVARLLGRDGAPDPGRDFTILGRVSRSAHVWAARADGPLATIGDVLAAAGRRPLVFPLNEVASADFISITVSAALLGVPIDLVPGFEGTRAAALAAVRGDVDLVCTNFEPLRSFFVAGDLRPILRVAVEPRNDLAILGNVPVLGGPDGMAARLALSASRDQAWAVETAQSLVRVIGSGRVVVAPRGLPSELSACLGGVLAEVLASEELRRVARGALDPAPAEVARADALAVLADAARLLPLIQPALQKLRG